MASGLDNREPPPHWPRLAGEARDPRRAMCRHGVGGNLVVGERAHPSANSPRPSDAHVLVPVTGDEVDGPADVARGQRVTYRLAHRPRHPMPGAGAFMPGGHQIRLGPGQLAAKHLREEVVIAVPLPDLVQGHDEEVLALEDADDLRCVRRPGDGVAQRRAEPVENGGPHEELPDLGGLAAEHLLGQEVDDEPVIAAELVNEGARRGVIAKRQRRQIDPRRPSGAPSSTAEPACTSAATSAGPKRNSCARNSTIWPTARNRASGSPGSIRVMITSWAVGGRWSSSSAIWSRQCGSLIT